MSPSIRKTSAGFTLIELMVVMVIISILFVGAYAPYDYYTRLSKVRLSTEKIHQSLENGKNLAQNGQIFPGTTKNANVWLLFKKWAHAVYMVASLSWSRSFTENNETKIINTIPLEDGVNINTLPQDTMLIEYSAPNGIMEIYKTPTTTSGAFDVGIGWKNSTTGTLYKTLKIEK